MLNADFWQDKIKSKNIIKEKKLFEDLINSYNLSTKQLKDLDDLYQLAIEENNNDIQSEINQNIDIDEIASDKDMVQKTKKVLELLEGLRAATIDDELLIRILKTQELVKEIKKDASND